MAKRKNAQIQIGENMVVLIIFFFLLVIAVIFYASVEKSRFSVKQSEAETASLLDLKSLVIALPELLCKEGSDVTEGCIDILNLEIMALHWESVKSNPQSDEREYYFQRLETSEITVMMLDPIKGAWTSSWTLYNNTGNLTDYRVVFIPVSLYNATSNDYSFGVIELKRYLR